MAKKKTARAKKALAPELPENMLPQNILPIGGHVEENKNIYISQAVYKQIHKFTRNKNTNESGGILVGTTIEEFGKTNIVISSFVEAKFCEATPTTLKFTHETWEYVHQEMEKKHPGGKIVGWIHTHPDFGIFLSEYDRFIHQNFFKEDYQVAYVVDPIQKMEGFYFWIDGKIEKCRGFYIYDKTGTEITVDPEKDSDGDREEGKPFGIHGILTAVLAVAVAFLLFANLSASQKLKELEDQQATLASSANQALAYMQQEILSQAAQIQQLKDALEQAGIPVEAAETQPEGASADDTSTTQATSPTEETTGETGEGESKE